MIMQKTRLKGRRIIQNLKLWKLRKVEKTKNLLNKEFQRVRLVLEFLRTKTELDLQDWDSKPKSLFWVGIEWMVNEPFKYMFIGLLISLALTIDGFLGLFLKATVGLMLLERLLLLKTNKGVNKKK